MWSLWTLYIILAVAVSIGRGDGPQGQGLASVRVEALLAKMTLEDKVGSQGVLCPNDLFACDDIGQLCLLMPWVYYIHPPPLLHILV